MTVWDMSMRYALVLFTQATRSGWPGCRPERVADKAAGRVSGRVGGWYSRFVR